MCLVNRAPAFARFVSELRSEGVQRLAQRSTHYIFLSERKLERNLAAILLFLVFTATHHVTIHVTIHHVTIRDMHLSRFFCQISTISEISKRF
jgi:hypothetical protein